MKNMLETKLLLTVKHTKPIGEMTDLIAGRAYTMDGVEDATATLLEGENEDPSNLAKESFDQLIQKFNALYKLDCPASPTIRFDTSHAFIDALQNFKSILQEEVNECDDIIAQSQQGESPPVILANLADWLGDLMVYCASELAKYGMKSDDVLRIIMASNFSKLGADGKPIYDERGKVLKGPSYWKPEPMIQRLIQAQARQAAKSRPTEPHGY